ncbi:MAG: LamG-like jellyroll fold domain-containing protein [Chloroflexota bacterium]
MSLYSWDTQARKTPVRKTPLSLGIIGLSIAMTICLNLVYSMPVYAQSALQDSVLYSTNATQIQVVPLVTTGAPNLATGTTVIASAYCESDLAKPAYSKILPVTGEWITIWAWDLPAACYSRFSANSSGGYDETQLGSWPTGWSVAGVDDVDGDGLDDLLLRHKVSSGFSAYQYRVALGQAGGSFDFSGTPVTYVSSTWTSQLMFADANDDGNSDIVYFNFAHGGTHNTAIQMHVGNGDGTFNTTPQPVFTSPHGATNLAFADFDEDTDLDIYLAPDDDVSDMGQSHIAFNLGASYSLQESLDFRPSNEGSTSDSFSASSIAYDVNLDGHMDLVTNQAVWSGGPQTTEVYWGDGTGNFALPSEVVLSGFNTGDPYTPRLEWGPLHTPNHCVAPPADMTAWWTLDENVGPMSTDIMGVPNNGTHVNNPTPIAGMVDGALSFNGQNYVEVPSHSELNVGEGDFSIDAWVRTTDASGVKILVDKRYENTAGDVQGYSFFLNSGRVGFQLANGNGTWFCSSDPVASSCTNYASGVSVADGEWHFVAVTVDRDDPQGGKFYVDGVQVATFNPTIRSGSLDNKYPLRIASRSSFETGLFRGDIDEVELFKRVLDADEIAAIYQAGSAGKCKDVQGLATIYITPEDSQIYASDIYTVNIKVDNIQNFYGAQVELAYDPAVIEVMDAYDFLGGVQLTHGDFLTAEATIFNTVDAVNGTINYAISLQGNKSGVSGSGTLAQIAVRGLVPGTSPVSLTQVILSDPQSQPISYTKRSGQIVVLNPTVDVTGQVILERRQSNAGAEVCIVEVAFGCVMTDASGFYTFTEVPMTGTLTVTHRSYLSSTYIYTGAAGSTVNVPTVTLLGGDIVKGSDAIINIADGSSMGSAWNSTPTDAHWNIGADITDDGVANILDMVAIQFNWKETAPGPWDTTLARSRRTARPVATRHPATVNQKADSNTGIQFMPAQTRIVELGGDATMEVHVENVTDLYAFDAVITFDPSKVQVKDVNPLEEGTQIRVGDFLDESNNYVLVNSVDNESGIIELAVTQLHPAEARQGSGVLGLVQFEGVAKGRSTVQFDEIQLVDAQGENTEEAMSSVAHGQIQVGPYLMHLPLIAR